MEEIKKVINDYFFNQYSKNLISKNNEIEDIEHLESILEDQGYSLYQKDEAMDTVYGEYIGEFQAIEWMESTNHLDEFCMYLKSKGLLLDIVINNETYYIMGV